MAAGEVAYPDPDNNCVVVPHGEVEGKIPYEISDTLQAALEHAVRDASTSPAAEPIILLSPACASYDQYKSFEHRGDHFRALATALPGFTKKALA